MLGELEVEKEAMKKHSVLLLFVIGVTFFFSSCATIIGGMKYNAKVQVPNHPDAAISVNGEWMGKGEANVLVKRRDADKLEITVQEENCEAETTRFTRKSFRGWAFVGTLLGWTGMTPTYIPLPWGVVVDACTGAWWKPDVTEKGVSKIDYDNFLYTINYQAIPKESSAIQQKETKKETPLPESKSKADKLRELKQLLDEGVLTQEEYEKEKAKILESEP